MAREKSQLSETERRLFRQEVSDVRPMRCDRHQHSPRRPPPRPIQQELDQQRVIDEMRMSIDFDPAEVETGDELLYARPGIQHSVLRRLRRGQYAVQAELDLHGYTAREAREEISDFLAECRARHIRCIRIIHGKGNGSYQKQPVLKRKVNNWLMQRDDVLAFCSARPVDGGTGALYALLRARR